MKLWTVMIMAFATIAFGCKDKDDGVSTGPVSGSLTDPRDGKVYATIQIGNQTWMAENLDYRPASGSWYFNDDSATFMPCGRLYDWNTAMLVAPVGWHVPSKAELETLVNHFGSDTAAYIQMISGGGSGFNTIFNGYRNASGIFNFWGSTACFWSSTQNDANTAWHYCLDKNHGTLETFVIVKAMGFSVRCVKD